MESGRPTTNPAATHAKNAALDTAQTLREGEMPSNVQLERVLDTTKQAIDVQEKTGHPGLQAHKVMEDTKEVLESAKQLIQEKNQGEIFQRFVQDTKEAVKTAPVPSTGQLQAKWQDAQGKFIIPDYLQAEARNTAENLRIVALEMVRSAEFRNLILEFINLMQETGRMVVQEKQERYFPETSTSGVGGMQQPSSFGSSGIQQSSIGGEQQFFKEGKLESSSSRFGEPGFFQGEQGQFGGQQSSTFAQKESFGSENIGLASPQGLPSTTLPSESFGSQSTPSSIGTSSMMRETEFGQKQQFPMEWTATPASQQPSISGTGFESATTTPIREETPRGYGTFEQTQQSPFEQQQSTFTPSDRPLHQDVKEMGKELYSDVKEGRIRVPEERRRELNRKFRDLVGKLSRNPNLNRATRGLMYLFEDIRNQLQGTVQQTKENVKDVTPSIGQLDQHTQQVREDAMELISQFTGRAELEHFLERLRMVFYQVKDDRELNNYLDDVRNYILETTENPSLLEDESHTNRVNDYIERGRYLFNRLKNQSDIRDVSNEALQLLRAIREDETTSRLSESLKKLVTDFAFDSRGQPSAMIAVETLNQLRVFLVPIILENLKMVQLPRIEGSDETYDFALEHIVFNGSDIMPDRIQIKAGADINVNLKELALEETVVSDIQLIMKDIESHMRNVDFWFKRKTFPKMEDEGTADVDLSSDTWIIVHWEILSFPKESSYVAGREERGVGYSGRDVSHGREERGVGYSGRDVSYAGREGLGYSTAAGVQQPAFRIRVKKIQVHLGGVKIHVKEAKHDKLLNILTSLFAGTIRKKIEQRLATNLFELLNGMDDRINELIANPTLFAERAKSSIQSIAPGAQRMVETGTVDVSGSGKKEVSGGRTNTLGASTTVTGSR